MISFFVCLYGAILCFQSQGLDGRASALVIAERCVRDVVSTLPGLSADKRFGIAYPCSDIMTFSRLRRCRAMCDHEHAPLR